MLESWESYLELFGVLLILLTGDIIRFVDLEGGVFNDIVGFSGLIYIKIQMNDYLFK